MTNLMIFLIITIIKKIFSIEAAFDIKPNKNFCIGEYLTEDTVTIFSIKTKSNKLMIELHDPQGKTIYSKNNNLEVRVSLTIEETGNYEICIKNNDNKIVEIEYQLLTGIQAQDFSQYAKESSIKPAEKAINKLRKMSNGLIKDFNTIIQEEEQNLKVNDAISGKISVVSILIVSVMLTVGFIEFFYIKKYLQVRKLI